MGRRRKLETLDDFQRALKNKYGLGESDSYKPWLRVQDVRSIGNSAKIQGIKAKREHHMLSEHESCFFYIAEFCDSVIDIREQFPLFPLDLSVKIAKTFGVKHPVVPGTKSPNVMTTDFVLTCSDGVNTWYEAVSVKPSEKLTDVRVAEKLDIERIWWQLLGVPFHLFVMTKENQIQSKNIQWITAPVRQGRRFSTDLVERSSALISPGTILIEDICDEFVREFDLEHDDALVLLKTLIATKVVNVDLNKPIADIGILNIIKVQDFKVVRHHAS
ncbi:TnsA endonuclease N-terminal domain-containing protein [Shewanella decolorationis]|uniref:TnsA endonuclease N-terminal domain-containing protein n=1 Tax=Shewanella decolorationis TaxID=256839 RepID=A0A5B8QSV7_9GAMM|nr:TnsA endonuclease N-terminal domain-containing protein [Shewanella decolorationis]QDZ89032.1 TnsA endonuclease N-terminal domain-containing protein [Shewanella decolorationis]